MSDRTASPRAPEPRPTWQLPRAALQVSYLEMGADGGRDREGIALWAGRGISAAGDDPVVAVTHVVLLRGPGVRRSRAQIRISAGLLNDVTDALSTEEGLYLVGQIHGHPPGSAVDLSTTDIAYGISMPDYLSLVAPDFGTAETPRIGECGVHEYVADAGFRRLSRGEVASRVQLEEGVGISVIVVGSAPGDQVFRTKGAADVR
jgi:hypothetical protein